MPRRILATALLAVLGAAILIALGVWQLQRHAWKQGVLAEIEARIAADPVALPAAPDPQAHAYLPVRVEGRIGGEEILVQASRKLVGPGFRVIAPLETADGRRVLLDRGFLPNAARDAGRPGGPVTVTGNLHWPDETDIFTPDPDREAGLWFARDVPGLARALDAEPVLVIARRSEPPAPGITPLPIGTEGIPDNHLGYAVQWFLMAAVWVAMAGAFLRGQWRALREAPAP